MKDILTGKAKEDFIRWLWLDKAWFESDMYLDEVELPPSLLLALQIEWLDTVDLIVDVTPIGENQFSYSLHSYVKGFETREEGRYSTFVNTRHEATERAIKAAVEVYNSR